MSSFYRVAKSTRLPVYTNAIVSDPPSTSSLYFMFCDRRYSRTAGPSFARPILECTPLPVMT